MGVAGRPLVVNRRHEELLADSAGHVEHAPLEHEASVLLTRPVRDAGSIAPASRKRPPRMQIAANGIALEVEDHGSPAGEPVQCFCQFVAVIIYFFVTVAAKGYFFVLFNIKKIGAL